MSPTLANFLFEAANFVLLAGALAYFSFKPLRKALQAERDRHAEQEQQIAAQREEAETLAQAAEQAHAQLDAELAKQRELARAQAQAEARRITDDARTAAETQRSAFEREQAAIVHATTGQLADAIGQIAAASVRRLLAQLNGPELDAALVRAACESLAGLAKGTGRATVEHARPLDQQSRTLLRARLGEFDERLVPELGAGVRVTTSTGQVDASASSIAREAAHELTEIAADIVAETPQAVPGSEQPDAARQTA